MTTAIAQRTLKDVLIGEPLQLAKDQPHQVLLSTGSVALMAQYAASNGIVHPFVGYCIALGVEWAYLRGLAYGASTTSRWSAILNWSAFAVVVLWGVLWVAGQYGLIGERVEGFGGWLLAAAHVAPVGWLALCSAMCHGAMTRELAAKQAATDRLAEEIAAQERQRHEAHAAMIEEQERIRQEQENRWRENQLALDLQKQQQAIEAEQIRLERLRSKMAQPTSATKKEPQPIIVDGVEYPSLTAAAAAHGITRQAMTKRVRQPKRNQEARNG